jgi:hypothetical protein
VYGPVRTVVWQGSVGDRRPYADLTAQYLPILFSFPSRPIPLLERYETFGTT